MDGFVLYDFKIDVWQPDTLPLKRLGEYAGKLANLFGATTDVHLLKIRKGSAVKELAVAEMANSGVVARLALVGTREASVELTNAYRDLNDLLRQDGGSAVLKRKGGARMVDFPGVKTPLADEVVIHETGALDGVVIRVGGSDETVPVWLEGENGERLKCSSTRSIAKELAQNLFGEPVRVVGNGKWRRNAERVWIQEEFVIKSWEPFKASSLEQAINTLRNVAGNGWTALDDPQAEWRSIRNPS